MIIDQAKSLANAQFEASLREFRAVGDDLPCGVVLGSLGLLAAQRGEHDQARARFAEGLPLLRRGYEPGAGLTTPIQRFQSGVVNDYVTWVVLGLAVIGGVLALIIR